ncbi:MAG: type I-E CRISPR-associated protein Cse1/CasA [Anaerolineaceae bacterium]|nr:type I-E CRISPR-associated protein Cse1/CasA [Anaerolineaceae bacterium]
MSSFNLLEEKWIDCIDLDGMNLTLSLSDLIIDSHKIRSLAGEFPVINNAMMFMVEALLISAFNKKDLLLNSPGYWADSFQAGRFEKNYLLEYFQTWRNRFDLFGEKLPFMQTFISEEREGQFTGTAMKLMPHFTGGTGGNSPTLFDHHTPEGGIAISPTQAAQFLLAAHYYGAGGRIMGSDYFSDAFTANGLAFFVQGKNLFETLMLNLLPYPDIDDVHTCSDDCPIWEREAPFDVNGRSGVKEGKNTLYIPFGLMDILTWPGRKIELIRDDDGFVRNIRMRAGLKIKQDYFPWFAYNRKGNYLRAREGRQIWRDYDVLLQFRQMNDPDILNRAPQAVDWLNENLDDLDARVFTIIGGGMAKEAGKQKVHFYSESNFPLPTEILDNNDFVIEISHCLEKAEAIRKMLYGATATLAKQILAFSHDKTEGRQPDTKDVNNLVNHLNAEAIYWETLEPGFIQLVLALSSDPDGSLRNWERDIQAAAKSALGSAIRLAGESIAVWKASPHANAVLEKGIREKLTLIRKETVYD